MKIKEIVKFAASAITGLGVGKTVDLVLKENLPVEMNWKARLATFIGSAALSGYISAKCSEHVEEEIDRVADVIEKVKHDMDVKSIEDCTEAAAELAKESE